MTKKQGLSPTILKTGEERNEEFAKRLSKFFLNKKFRPGKYEKDAVVSCVNYLEKLDIHVSYRVQLVFKHSENQLRSAFLKHSESYDEFKYPPFKYYWNGPIQCLYVYKDLNNQVKFDWENSSFESKAHQLKSVIEIISRDILNLIGR
ncbi:MAG: hypothetical protein KI790_01220 [Cyclobacteriaceae bacterium]|nr:hypothetical protein [Cyclobacteriaceae bacterium HetDA_MAG_MS6]